MIELMNQR